MGKPFPTNEGERVLYLNEVAQAVQNEVMKKIEGKSKIKGFIESGAITNFKIYIN